LKYVSRESARVDSDCMASRCFASCARTIGDYDYDVPRT